MKYVDMFLLSKWPWIILVLSAAGSVITAHFFFQEYLFMQPCIKCVSVRVAMVIMALGGILGLFGAKSFKLFGFALIFGGIFWGLMNAFTLEEIRMAKERQLAPVFSCGSMPSTLVPLEKSMPSLFKPTGECGEDTPSVGAGVKLSKTQEYLIKLYAQGFYLFPKQKLITLPQICIAYLLASFAVFGAVFFKFVRGNKARA
ncbi:MAG: disulfide bond formation protein B [Helicobacteraceae bacterium]